MPTRFRISERHAPDAFVHLRSARRLRTGGQPRDAGTLSNGRSCIVARLCKSWLDGSRARRASIRDHRPEYRQGPEALGWSPVQLSANRCCGAGHT